MLRPIYAYILLELTTYHLHINVTYSIHKRRRNLVPLPSLDIPFKMAGTDKRTGFNLNNSMYNGEFKSNPPFDEVKRGGVNIDYSLRFGSL